VITITSIEESAGDQPYREFFQKEFPMQRLGKPGYWQGGAVERLQLQNPVNLATFQNLLHGQSPDGTNRLVKERVAPHHPLGWRLTVTTSPSVTLLWALAPPETRLRIERAHLLSVRNALQQFERAVGGGKYKGCDLSQVDPVGLFARFNCGAACDQSPHLHTTAFFFNFALHRDGTVRTFTTDEVCRQRFRLEAASEKRLRYQLIGVIGPYMEEQWTDLRIRGVPQELASKFRFDPSFKLRSTNTLLDRSELWRSDQLFKVWKLQAQAWGWGPKHAEQFLTQARCVLVGRYHARRCMRGLFDTARLVQDVENAITRSIARKLNTSKQKRARQSRDKDISHSH